MVSLFHMAHADTVINATVDLPTDVYYQLETRARQEGCSVAEYLARLITHAAEEDIPMVDEETEKRIAEGRADIKAGRYITIKPGDKKAMRKALWGE